MGISPNLIQVALDTLVLLVALLAVAIGLQVVPRSRIRVRRPTQPRSSGYAALRFFSAVGLVVAGALPAGAVPLQRKPRPAWAHMSSQVETGGPPPLPSVRPRRDPRPSASHPAIHRDSQLVGPLFPRAKGARDGDASAGDEQQRSRSMDLHPAGKALRLQTYEVKLGDTLWDIAAHVLGTENVARIARYWPALHKANVDILGRDPHRIFPGQVLRLPREKA